MMEIKYEDFERFRKDLRTYAINLTKKVTSDGYYLHIDKADDLVQDTYLIYHDWLSGGNKIENFDHLWNFLKLIMYKAFIQGFDKKRKGGQYLSNEIKVDINTFRSRYHPKTNLLGEDIFNFDLNQLSNKLTDKQRYILFRLLNGEAHWEIGSILGVSRQAVVDQVYSIRKKLKELND